MCTFVLEMYFLRKHLIHIASSGVCVHVVSLPVPWSLAHPSKCSGVEPAFHALDPHCPYLALREHPIHDQPPLNNIMKYIEVPALGLLASVISGSQNGASRACRIDKYLAGKVARRNRASAKQIEDRILKHLQEQPDSPELTSSALGDMHQEASRKLLGDLISTLNSISPDLTFECVACVAPLQGDP